MAWDFTDNAPIYMQIVNGLQREIASGAYAPGTRLPSVRDLAMEAGVNPNTMQRALAELEQRGLVNGQRTDGRSSPSSTHGSGRTRQTIRPAARSRPLQRLLPAYSHPQQSLTPARSHPLYFHHKEEISNEYA